MLVLAAFRLPRYRAHGSLHSSAGVRLSGLHLGSHAALCLQCKKSNVYIYIICTVYKVYIYINM